MKKLTLFLCFVSFLTNAQNITVDSGKSFTIEKTGSVTRRRHQNALRGAANDLASADTAVSGHANADR